MESEQSVDNISEFCPFEQDTIEILMRLDQENKQAETL